MPEHAVFIDHVGTLKLKRKNRNEDTVKKVGECLFEVREEMEER